MCALDRLRPDREEGNALVIAVMVLGVCMSLALVGVQLALGSSRASGVDRQRVLAVDAAEAGVDSAYSAIQSAGLDPPCSLTADDVKSGPDTASYGTTITYYDAANTALACPLSVTPARALIRSTAQTTVLGGGGSRGRRTIEALVALTPQTANDLNRAVFAHGTLSFDNRTTVIGNSGPDADLYSNADVKCANNENFAGSIYTQGSATLSNGCTIAGNLWAKNGVQKDGAWNGSIAGSVKSGVSGINLASPGSVSGNLYAAGSIAHSNCPSKCFPNSSPGNPPFQPFPILRGDDATMAKWRAAPAPTAPYTVYDNSDCSTLGARIVDTYARKGTSTLLRTTCAVALTSDVVLSNDLAIFAYGGLTTGRVQLRSSTPGTGRAVHFVVPYDAAVTRPCSTPVLDTDKQFELSNDIGLLLYSPCDINYRNSSNHIGQIYGGSDVTIENQFTLQYRPVPVFGIDPSSLSSLGYTPSVVYKRETR